MYCKKCGAKLEEQDIFCYFCGATVEKSTETVEKDNYYESTSVDTNNLLKIYVGQNEDKIKEGKFSFPTFFLGPIYLLYRKMTLAAILWIIANVAATIFISEYSWILSIVAHIIFAIKFNEFYLETAKNKIEKIKEQSQDKSSGEITNLVRKKGGVSILPIVLIVVMTLILSTVIAIFTTFANITSEFSNIFEDVENYTQQTTEDIYFDYTIPKGFEVGTESSIYRRYSYYGDKSYCSVMLQNSSISIYDSTEDYLKSNVYTNGTYTVSEITQKDINGEVWLYQTVESTYSKKYYYAIESSNKYHLVTFEVNDDEDGFCSKSHEEFINSLKLKNNTSNKNEL